ncbi:MAG TPA: aldo/keto reductase [Polyangia bacterium]|nr:aldo/keto reductase [Polyangia bacterium]
MRHAPFGPGGRPVPIIGLGTWQMEDDDRASCVAALRAGLDAGATHVDTAELYGWGVVEELVGEAIAGRRDEIFLVSKVHPRNAARAKVLRACEQSLARLRTDHLDVYLLHWRESHPLEDTLGALEELVTSGKIRAWGVSNFDENDLDEALRLVGPGKIACNQVLYHLEERAIEHAVLPWCKQHGVALVGYSPFAVGRFLRGRGKAVVEEIARARGATARQVVLAFLTREPALFTIPKSADPEHTRENAAAADLVLTPDELARIDAAFPTGRPRGLPTG